jgi:hypothetical protein
MRGAPIVGHLPSLGCHTFAPVQTPQADLQAQSGTHGMICHMLEPIPHTSFMDKKYYPHTPSRKSLGAALQLAVVARP